MEILKIVLLVLGSYLVGNINTAVIISKMRGGDIRKAGSGNPGTMNMIRTYGKTLGVITLIVDALKAIVCCVVACLLFGYVPFCTGNNLYTYIAGIAVTVGHIYPVFMKFKGGKGIACIIGVNLVANPLVTGITFAVALIVIIVVKVGTFGTLSMILVPLIYNAYELAGTDIAASVLMFCMAALALFAHRTNIIKLYRGRETLTYIFKKKQK